MDDLVGCSKSREACDHWEVYPRAHKQLAITFSGGFLKISVGIGFEITNVRVA